MDSNLAAPEHETGVTVFDILLLYLFAIRRKQIHLLLGMMHMVCCVAYSTIRPEEKELHHVGVLCDVRMMLVRKFHFTRFHISRTVTAACYIINVG